MAIWQYTFHVLSRDSIEILGGTDYIINKDFEFNDDQYWKIVPIHRAYFESLNSILLKNISWSKNIDLYGEQNSNCFEIGFDNRNIVESASFRIDASKYYDDILINIIEFCKLKKLVILDQELNIVAPEHSQLKQIINSTVLKNVYSISSTTPTPSSP